MSLIYRMVTRSRPKDRGLWDSRAFLSRKNLYGNKFWKYEYSEFIAIGTTMLKGGNRIGVLTVFTFHE